MSSAIDNNYKNKQVAQVIVVRVVFYIAQKYVKINEVIDFEFNI